MLLAQEKGILFLLLVLLHSGHFLLIKLLGLFQVCLLFIFYSVLISRERGREGERAGEQHQSVASCTGGQTPNLGMSPDPESNPKHFGLCDDAPTN